jgi:hypothetical protein
MFKKIFFQGVAAGLLAAIASIIYNRIYFFAFEVNFSKLVNIPVLTALSLLACTVAAIGYWLIKKRFGERADIIFNFSFVILSFASILVPMAAKLPLDIQNPEMFPCLTVPMHFFPALAWFTLNPLFKK